MRIPALIALLGAAALDTIPPAPAAPIGCASLAPMKLMNGRVLSAEAVPAGAFAAPGASNPTATAAFKTLPALCHWPHG